MIVRDSRQSRLYGKRFTTKRRVPILRSVGTTAQEPRMKTAACDPVPEHRRAFFRLLCCRSRRNEAKMRNLSPTNKKNMGPFRTHGDCAMSRNLPALSRRGLLISGALAATGAVALRTAVATETAEQKPFRYCFNTGTVLGKKLPITEIVDAVGKAGYDGIEPWIREIDAYTQAGGSLADLRKRIADAGLTVESAISFPAWAVDDDQRRRDALEQIKREMDIILQLGGKRIAAPPSGINRAEKMDLRVITDRYRTVLEIGDKMGCTPQLEIWGSATNLGTLCEAAFVLTAVGHPRACGLFDVFHLYRGNSPFEGLRQLNGAQMHVFHINDYPAEPPREEINDSYRVLPGDGTAPMREILTTLYETGYRGALSLELFNRSLWERELDEIVTLGLAKMKTVVREALGTA
ncbi:MAG: sugar phosphate isomerase/epimerase [Planctomycetota bacterium]|nr:MAG: sugar phosphate isomerase/epimerase [Planctomycetota bacterium]